MDERIARIETKIEKTIDEWKMLEPGCSVVAGFSGGADSSVLVHFLSRYCPARGITLTAAHVNHGLRGPESDSDEALAARWCEQNGVELKVLHADVRETAQRRHIGEEECGREVRYSFFRSLSGESGRIATAHTLSDCAETVLLNLTRGAGARGLGGIPPVRGNIIRPLINITRAEVEAYCGYYGLSYATDSTNLQPDYTRNRIRLQVIPFLREINPNFEQCVSHTVHSLRQDEECLSQWARRELDKAKLPGGGYGLDVFRSQPDAVLARMIAFAAVAAGAEWQDFEHITAIAALVREGRGSITSNSGIQCTAYGNTLFIMPAQELRQPDWSVPLHLPETVLPDGRVVCLRERKCLPVKNSGEIKNFLFNNVINYDTILNTNSFIRNKRPGDAYIPQGRGHTKPLKKLFNEAKIPPLLRGRRAVLECGGKIVWVEGFGVSVQAAPVPGGRAAEILVKECLNSCRT